MPRCAPRVSRSRLLLWLFTFALSAPPLPAQALPFDNRWQLNGDETRRASLDGRSALLMRSGVARRDDVRLQDGTIDVDVMMSPHRSFVYLLFRAETTGQHEELYLRTHKSDLPDALQYSPVWNGESNWQLYHGPGATASATIPRGAWTHLRLVLQGQRAALFIGADTVRPALVMELARAPRAGGIALRSFVPAGTEPATGPFTAFANVVVRPGTVPFDFSRHPVTPLPRVDGLVTRWQLGPAAATPADEFAPLPASVPAERAQWPAFDVEPHGVLVIGRHLRRPAPNSRVVARLVLRAERDTVAPLVLGFSDIATVYANGQPIMRGHARYTQDQPRQEGVIGLHQGVAWLPLRQGENEVLVQVSDDFGGWGVMGRVVGGYGVSVHAPP